MNKANIRAEAFSDQVKAALRNGDPIPDGPICAAAARTIPDAATSSPEFNRAQKRLLESLAELHGVDRPST